MQTKSTADKSRFQNCTEYNGMNVACKAPVMNSQGSDTHKFQVLTRVMTRKGTRKGDGRSRVINLQSSLACKGHRLCNGYGHMITGIMDLQVSWTCWGMKSQESSTRNVYQLTSVTDTLGSWTRKDQHFYVLSIS